MQVLFPGETFIIFKMDVVRLRLSRSQSAVQPRSRPGTRPASSHHDSACATRMRQRPTTSLPVNRSTFPEFRDERLQKPDYLMSGKAIQPTDVMMPRPRTGRKDSVDQVPDVTSRHTRARTAIGKAKNSETCENPHLRPGHLQIRLRLDDLDIAKPESFESWMRAFERKRLRMYSAILRQEEALLDQLTKTLDVPGVHFKQITLGSLILHAHFDDVDAFSNFKELHRSGKLTDDLNHVLVTDDLMQEVGVDGVAMSAHVQTADIRRCHHELNVRKSTNKKSAAHEILPADRDQNKPQSKCVQTINTIQSSFEMSVDTIRQKYSAFEKKLEKFLMVLKLTKPLDIDEYASLDDVIKCFQFLQTSESIGRNVRTDLVRDFLAIINILRVKVTAVKSDLDPVKGYILKCCGKDALDDIYEVCGELEGHYETSFQFGRIQDATSPSLGVMDRQLFTGLVAYVPWLLAQTDQLYRALDDLRAKVTVDGTESETLIDVQFRRAGTGVEYLAREPSK